MGISVLTALTIQSRDVRCEAAGPDQNGKWAGWIMLDVDRWHPLLNSEPIYDNAQDARTAMEKVVKEIRETEVENPLDSMPEGSMVKKIIAASQDGISNE
jgi:hypothetical protein